MNDLKFTLDEINQPTIQPVIQEMKDGLKEDEIKNLTDADKFYYNEKNFKWHFNKINNNIDKCRYKCMKITGDYDASFDYEACKKGCHIESPYYCEECPNEEMNGKIFYFDEEKKPFKGDCKTSGNKEHCEKGKKYFNEIWSETYEDNGYKISNEKITENNDNKCKGDNNFYEDTNCAEEKTLKKRFINLINSYKEYKKEDRNTYDNMVNLMMKLRKENNEKKSANNTEMINLVEKYNKLQEGMTDGQQKDRARSGRLEDNKLKSESDLYKNIAISVLGITLLLITAKKLNSL